VTLAIVNTNNVQMGTLVLFRWGPWWRVHRVTIRGDVLVRSFWRYKSALRFMSEATS